MKKTLLLLGAATLLLGVPSASAANGPAAELGAAGLEFPRQYVPASASLVAHVDLEAFQRSTLWKLVESRRDEFGFEEMEAELGFDPFDVVRSVTVYGTEGEPEVAVIVASSQLDRLLDKLEQEGELTHLHEDGLDLIAVDDAVGYVHRTRSGRVLVLGEGARRVIGGARVVRGETRSLADASGEGLNPAPVEGSFLFLAADGTLPGMDGFEPASQVLGLAQGVQFDLGEAGGSLFAHLALDTGSVETARDVSDTVQGLLALGRIALRTSDEVPPGVEDLLHALAVRSRGGVVSVDFEYSVRALVELLEGLEEEGDD